MEEPTNYIPFQNTLTEYFTERTRRRSIFRIDFAATLTDPVPQQSLPAFEDIHLRSGIAAATSTEVVVSAIHLQAQTVESESSTSYRRQANLPFAAVCWCFLLGGWNNGTTVH
ncbi:uncharacterized protein ARMOST_16873 [Armillaria ostoyae]|uniref:Uncharacterized protein n=1 Tax=Armillaria ostoyae TaxID=47428 RepID=A0A284RXF9_ARMOS|nr:uncharacterized protein ARMOST_16831 [Armillaria ostoyae]SJL13430.1 uncharacterized protein ARMOST_16873 [Armillaria ostoyae]